MRTLSDLALSSLTGSQSGVRLVADVWRGGKLLTLDGPLPVASWSVSWDATRQIQGQASLTIADSDGLLAPWGLDDTLGAAGSRMHLRYRMPSASEEVSLGWFRITAPDVTESWRFHPTSGRWISTGSTVRVEASELTWQVMKERFLALESPAVTGSVFGELRRLLDGIMPLGSTVGIIDKAVPAGIVYTLERADAVEDLAASVGATLRMSSAGLLDLIPTTPGPSVWSISAADSDTTGVLIDLARAQSAADLPNAAIVQGTASDGSAIIGRAFVPGGPLMFGGPHGRIPVFLSSPLMDTQAKCDAAAATFLASTLAQQRTVLPVTCLPHPGLQVGDTVSIVSAIGTMTGTVQTVTLAGDATGVRPMTLGVSVGANQLAIIAGARLAGL